jgi:hypothetical protein
MTTIKIDIEFEGEDDDEVTSVEVEVEFSVYGGYSPQTWESPAESPEVEFESARVHEFGRWYVIDEEELEEFVCVSELGDEALERATDCHDEPDDCDGDVDYDYPGDCRWEP